MNAQKKIADLEKRIAALEERFKPFQNKNEDGELQEWVPFIPAMSRENMLVEAKE